ncbi:hypothetical protein ANN_22548 [Periplaneta americana]|uniref:Reverse transcriptase n=1 Tax=Periplaneta americana TaxID=6978 RepID=A0ABQ8S8F1_PERAM|nr:hypothetical protein ANN_22548 [Periplaneta americana]
MAGLCEGSNEPAGFLKAVCKYLAIADIAVLESTRMTPFIKDVDLQVSWFKAVFMARISSSNDVKFFPRVRYTEKSSQWAPAPVFPLMVLKEKEMILSDMLLELNDSCEQCGMKINANKTKTMVIERKVKKNVLERVNEERMMLKLIRKWKRNWLGHWLGRNCLLKDALEEMVNRRRVMGRRRYHMIDNIKIYGSYAETKRKAENRKDWRMLDLQ